MPLHVSSTVVLIIRRSHCVIEHLVSSHSVGGRLRTGRPPTEIPDNIIYLFTAIGLLTGGSGYLTP